jgi:hypothetical protein
MTGLVADHNTEGHLIRLIARLTGSEFAEEWDRLDVPVESFASIGLLPDTDDRTLWSVCQARGLILVTANRNHDGVDSLEAAIRDGGPTALPVLTYGNATRILTDPSYAEAAAISLLGYLLDLIDRPETVLGTGRLYLPKSTV